LYISEGERFNIRIEIGGLIYINNIEVFIPMTSSLSPSRPITSKVVRKAAGIGFPLEVR
jgi:hypothetical protein